MTVRHDTLAVTWLGYATVRLESDDGTVVYVDPGRYGPLPASGTETFHTREGVTPTSATATSS